MRAFFILIVALVLTSCFSNRGKLLSASENTAITKSHGIELKSESHYNLDAENTFQSFDSLVVETKQDGTTISKIYGGVKSYEKQSGKSEAIVQSKEQETGSIIKEIIKKEEQKEANINSSSVESKKETNKALILIAIILALILSYMIFKKIVKL